MENEEQTEVAPKQTPQEPIVPVLEKKSFNYPLFVGAIVVVIAVLAGYFVITQDKSVVIETEETSDNVGETIEIDPITGWNIYRNEKYGYEFQYPTDQQIFGINEAGGTIDIKDNNYTGRAIMFGDFGYIFQILPGTVELGKTTGHFPNLDSWYTSREEWAPTTSSLPVEKTVFLGRDAYYGLDSGNTASYFVVVKNRIVQIDYYTKSDVAKQVFSSLKFIDSPTSDWQTYRNEEYGFEIKFPVNYSLKEYEIEENQRINTILTLTKYRDRVFDTGIGISLFRDESKLTNWCNSPEHVKGGFITIDNQIFQKCMVPEFYGSGIVAYEIWLGGMNDAFLELSCGPPRSFEIECDEILSTFKFIE